MQTEYLDRLYSHKMEYYRYVYRDSPRWNGSELIENETILVYCEQGLGDTLQFARYFQKLKSLGCRVILHCPTPLHRLLKDHVVGVDEVLDRNNPDLPPHRFHVLSMSLPFVLGSSQAPTPYIQVTKKTDLSEFQDTKKIGIAWEGNPDHSNNEERCCHLRHFKNLADLPQTNLFMLQKEIQDYNLVQEVDFELFSTPLNDMLEVAEFINALDVIVSVDTSILHLAGAMGKPTFGLLSYNCDYRWEVQNWYPTTTLLRQPSAGNWKSVFESLLTYL